MQSHWKSLRIQIQKLVPYLSDASYFRYELVYEDNVSVIGKEKDSRYMDLDFCGKHFIIEYEYCKSNPSRNRKRRRYL